MKGKAKMKVEHGFTFYHEGNDYFYKTNRQNIVTALCNEILDALNYPKTESNQIALARILSEAEFETKITNSGKSFWIIRGIRKNQFFETFSPANDGIILLN